MLSFVDPSPDPASGAEARGAMGMRLFLLALGILFAASMLGYVLIRFSPRSPAAGTLHLPPLLLLSTMLMLASSFTMQRALAAGRRADTAALRRSMLMTLVLAGAFILVQTPALLSLLGQHQKFRGSGLGLYGLIFFLILLHALHVAGGIVALVRAAAGAWGGPAVHNQPALRYASMYWHFLDGVWLALFAVLWLSR